MSTINNARERLSYYSEGEPCAMQLFLPADVYGIDDELTEEQVANVLAEFNRGINFDIEPNWDGLEDAIYNERCKSFGYKFRVLKLEMQRAMEDPYRTAKDRCEILGSQTIKIPDDHYKVESGLHQIKKELGLIQLAALWV